MSSDDLIEIEGVIKEALPGGEFVIEIEGSRFVKAHLGGRLRKNRIRVVLRDRVTVQVSPYDPTKGRIVFRHK